MLALHQVYVSVCAGGSIGVGKGRLYKSRTKASFHLIVLAASFLCSHPYPTVHTPGICDIY